MGGLQPVVELADFIKYGVANLELVV